MKKICLKTKNFIERAIDVHGDKFAYTNTKVKSYGKEVAIDCQRHGTFMQTPTQHLREQGCPYCAYNRMTKVEFIANAIKLYGDIFDFSKCNYTHKKTSTDKITIFCKNHGEFETSVRGFLHGTGCPKCEWETKLKARLHKKDNDATSVGKPELGNNKHVTFSVSMHFKPANSIGNGVISAESFDNKEEAEKFLSNLRTAVDLTDSRITKTSIAVNKESLVDAEVVAVIIKSLKLKSYEDFLKWWDKTYPVPIPRNLHECYPNFKRFFNGNEVGVKSTVKNTIILPDYISRKIA